MWRVLAFLLFISAPALAQTRSQFDVLMKSEDFKTLVLTFNAVCTDPRARAKIPLTDEDCGNWLSCSQDRDAYACLRLANSGTLGKLPIPDQYKDYFPTALKLLNLALLKDTFLPSADNALPKTTSPCRGLNETTCKATDSCGWVVPSNGIDRPYCRTVASRFVPRQVEPTTPPPPKLSTPPQRQVKEAQEQPSSFKFPTVSLPNFHHIVSLLDTSHSALYDLLAVLAVIALYAATSKWFAAHDTRALDEAKLHEPGALSVGPTDPTAPLKPFMMHLTVRRTHRLTFPFRNPNFALQFKLHVSDEDHALIRRYKLRRLVLHSSERFDKFYAATQMGKSPLTWFSFRFFLLQVLAFFGLLFSFKVTVRNLLRGKRVASKDLGFIIECEHEVVHAANQLKNYIETARKFDGRVENIEI